MTHPWPKVQEIFRALRPCWLATVLVIVLCGALHHEQALDALEEAGRSFVSGSHLGLMLAIVAVALCGWYCSRALLYVRYWFTPVETLLKEATLYGVRRHTPRLLGLLPILALSAAFVRTGRIGFGVFYVIVAGAFLAALILRRRWVGGGYALRAALPSESRRVLLGLLTISLILLIVFIRSPVRFPQLMGPIAIVVYAVTSWIVFGSFALVYPSYRFRIPSLVVVMIVYTSLLSLWNDNHGVRRGHAETATWGRQTVKDHFRAWSERRRAGWEQRFGSRPYPVFVVAAEGGGIRAAYWTASVLASLERDNPGFACHVFAISGVSGGSLGGAVFAALVAGRLDESDYACDGRLNTEAGEIWQVSRRVLSEDFLGPALAGMLFPDLMQRFNPFPDTWPVGGALAFPDRAEHLEQAWEAAWRRHVESDRLDANLRDLWKDHPLEVPSLFLNGTWVESGGRVVTSNLRPAESSFVELEDAVGLLARPLRLSTAVHMSARFTYVSPAGRMPDGRRVVDGGYFENSGALTAAEILPVLHEADAGLNFRPVVLIITNSPSIANGSSGFLSETLAPVLTLYNTRRARGFHAEDFLAKRVCAGKGLPLRFPLTGAAKAPLGWMLSRETQESIDSQADDLPEAATVGELMDPGGEVPARCR